MKIIKSLLFANIAVFLFSSINANKSKVSILDLLNNETTKPQPETQIRFMQKEEGDEPKKLDATKLEAAKMDKSAEANKSKEEKERANLRKGKNQTVITSMFSTHREKLNPGAYKEMNEK